MRRRQKPTFGRKRGAGLIFLKSLILLSHHDTAAEKSHFLVTVTAGLTSPQSPVWLNHGVWKVLVCPLPASYLLQECPQPCQRLGAHTYSFTCCTPSPRAQNWDEILSGSWPCTGPEPAPAAPRPCYCFPGQLSLPPQTLLLVKHLVLRWSDFSKH